jgi:hypothetical protein
MKVYIGVIVGLLIIIAFLTLALFRKANASEEPPVLVRATIDGVYWAGTKPFPKGMSDMPMNGATVALSIANSYPNGKQKPVEVFIAEATPDFLLQSPGHPDLHVHLSNTVINSAWAHYEGFLGNIDPADESNIAHGATYSISPVHDAGRPVHWTVKEGLSTTAP